MPLWSKGDDAGPSTRKLRVRVPPGVLAEGVTGASPLVHLVVGELGLHRRLRAPEIAGSNPAGQIGRGGAPSVLPRAPPLRHLATRRGRARAKPALASNRPSSGDSQKF